MEIGKPKRIVESDPIVDPVPDREPTKLPATPQPDPSPTKEPVKVCVLCDLPGADGEIGIQGEMFPCHRRCSKAFIAALESDPRVDLKPV